MNQFLIDTSDISGKTKIPHDGNIKQKINYEKQKQFILK